MTTSNDPDQIRREIERTRVELSDDVNALGDKVNPGSIARRQVGRVRGAATTVKEAVMGKASDAADRGQDAAYRVSDTMSSMGDTVSQTPSMVVERAKGSPIAAGLIAFGAGLLVSSMLPPSRTEQQAAQAVKDAAQPAIENLTDAAKETAEKLKEPAQQAVQEIKSTATDAAQTVKQEATDAAGQVKEQAAESKDTVQNAAR
jgi:ElaB/YqjD/DUF883 family membrane-anchored ribosome-binding protein